MHFRSRFPLLSPLVAAIFLVCPAAANAFGEADPTFRSASLPEWSCSGKVMPLADEAAFVTLFTGRTPNTDGIAKFEADGQLDSSWGQGGVAVIPSSFNSIGFEAPQQFLPLPGGGLLALGVQAFRFDANGAIDPTFGTRGVSTYLWTNGERPQSASLQPDGGVVVLAMNGLSEPNDAVTFTRLSAAGLPDANFGSRGNLPVRLPTGSFVVAWSIGADGAAEVATYRLAENGDVIPELRRFPADSSAAHSTVSGRLLPRHGLANWLSPLAAADAFGNLLLVIGRDFQASPAGVKLAMFDRNGQLVPDFGDSGTAFIPLPGPGPSSIPTLVHPKSLWRTQDGGWLILAGSSQAETFGTFGAPNVMDNTTRAIRLSANGFLSTALVVGGAAMERFARLNSGKTLHAAPMWTPCALIRTLTGEPRIEATMIEYHDPTLDRYFMTLEGPESVHLDQNVAQIRLQRTGWSFGAWAPAQLPGAKRLCRFVGDDGKAGTGSHFYTPEGPECDGLRALDAATPVGSPAWRFEGFAASVVDAANEACPANLTPVYRVYNRGFSRGITSNHRYMTDIRLYEEMVRNGWAPEGVRFCVPPVATPTTPL